MNPSVVERKPYDASKPDEPKEPQTPPSEPEEELGNSVEGEDIEELDNRVDNMPGTSHRLLRQAAFLAEAHVLDGNSFQI